MEIKCLEKSAYKPLTWHKTPDKAKGREKMKFVGRVCIVSQNARQIEACERFGTPDYLSPGGFYDAKIQKLIKSAKF